LPRTDQYAFEFRHESWFADDIYALLREYQTSLCLAESETLTTPEVLTAGFAYFRLRKPDYADAELNALSEKFKGYLAEGRTIYALFKHEETPAGALCAERVLQLASPRT
jgi:uncharacterized protein YecE (DUF72 family)